MFTIFGEQVPDEITLDHWEGYMGSGPVRIGNGANKQYQADIYGELMDSLYLYNKHVGPINYDFWVRIRRRLDWICDNWQLPDEGIWEMRSGKQNFVYSKLMNWVALDRGIRLSLDYGDGFADFALTTRRSHKNSAAFLSDLVGRKPVLIVASLLLLAATQPLLADMIADPRFFVVLRDESACGVLIGLFSGPFPAAVTELFPTRARMTATDSRAVAMARANGATARRLLYPPG